MGFLIDGNKQDADDRATIEESQERPYQHLSNRELKSLHEQTIKDITKYNNFQMARKIALNSAYGSIGNQ